MEKTCRCGMRGHLPRKRSLSGLTALAGLLTVVLCAGCAGVRIGTDSATPITMKSERGRPFIPVLLNGKGPYWFAVDTGWQTAADISPRVERDLKLRRDKDRIVLLDSFAVGEMVFKNFDVFVDDNPKLWDLLGNKTDGIIGMGFLKYFEVTINYPRSTMSFVPAFSFIGKHQKPKPTFSYVRIKYSNHYIVVPTYVNGAGPYSFVLDTGSSKCIISTEIADRLSLARSNPHPARGAVDDIACWDSSVESLKVGNKAVPNLQVGVMDCADVSKMAECKIDGYIGCNFLKHCAVTFSVLDLYIGIGTE